MNKKISFISGLLGLSLLLTSCQNYQRNYAGPLRDRDDVAFLFNYDSTIRGELALAQSPETNLITQTVSIPKKSKPFFQLFGAEAACRELLPGKYFVKLYKTAYEPYPDNTLQLTDPEQRVRENESVILENLDTWNFGPYRLRFNARPGHIYLVDCICRQDNWYQFPEGPWEINIKDVTDAPEFQKSLQKIKRK